MKKLFERLTLPVFLIILTEIGCAFFATTSESEQMNSSTLGVPLTMYLGAILFAWYSAWNLLYIAFRQRRRVNVSKLLPDETAALVEGIIYLGSSIGNTYLLHKCYVQRHDLQLAEHASNIMMWVRSDYITLVIWVVVLIPVLIVSFSAKSEDKVNLFRIFAIMLIGVPQLLAAQQIYCY